MKVANVELNHIGKIFNIIQPFNTKLTDGRTDERNDEHYIRTSYEGYIFVTIRNLGIFLYPNKV